MAKCVNYEKNMQNCNCTYEPCGKKGMCCECLRSHLAIGEVPACFFSERLERTYDRSIENFIKHYRSGR